MSEGRLVLVCDDDPLLLDLLEFRLGGRGYRVAVARDGGEAIARMQEEVPAAVVLDAMMPVMDGYQVLRRIRSDHALDAVKVVMLTARHKERDIVEALELGADDYIVKPFIPEELVARLARLVGSAVRRA